MKTKLFPSYTIGPDAYNEIAEICMPFGKKIAVIGGERAINAAKNKIKSAEVNLIINRPIDSSTLSREEQNNLSEKIKEIIEESLDKSKPI